MKNAIPQYNVSYSEEENKQIHEYLQTATDSELVRSIFDICNLYPESTRQYVTDAIQNFIHEIRDRDMMKQKYDALLKCKEAWRKYCNDLYRYEEVKEIRHLYENYKDEKKECKEANFLAYLDNKHPSKYNVDFIRKCTFSEESKNGIKKPEQPNIKYTSLDSVIVSEQTPEEYLQTLGTENLKQLFELLLYYIDEAENPVNAFILFLTRKYSYESHKSNRPAFSSSTPDYLTLRQQCEDLLDEIQSLVKEANTY